MLYITVCCHLKLLSDPVGNRREGGLLAAYGTSHRRTPVTRDEVAITQNEALWRSNACYQYRGGVLCMGGSHAAICGGPRADQRVGWVALAVRDDFS
jgi:hypothetical protein